MSDHEELAGEILDLIKRRYPRGISNEDAADILDGVAKIAAGLICRDGHDDETIADFAALVAHHRDDLLSFKATEIRRLN